jgi:hypothetical protein
MEDDLEFSPLMNRHFGAVQEAFAQNKWGFAYLGHVEKVSNELPLMLVPTSRPLVTAHFYAVNGDVFDRLIEYLEQVQKRPPGHPAGGPMHLDGALTMFRKANPDILTLIAQPNLGWQHASRSDLHSNWFQSAPVFGKMYDVGRFVRRVLSRSRHA